MSFLKIDRYKLRNIILIFTGTVLVCIITFFMGYQLGIKEQEKVEEIIIEAKSQEELEEMLVKIQKQYIFEEWYLEEKAEHNMPRIGEGDILQESFKLEDLEEVIFYQDLEGIIYFIPTSMVNKRLESENGEIQLRECSIEGGTGYYLYYCEFYEAKWRRIIYPEPDSEYVDIFCSKNLEEKIKELYLLGRVRVSLPESMPEGQFQRELYENEYTDAVVDIIHSYLGEKEKYGKYQIYIGYYGINRDFKDISRGYNIWISAVIMPLNKGIEDSYSWMFRAKDVLREDGSVVVEAVRSTPDEYDLGPDGPGPLYPGIVGPEMKRIVKFNRLIIPLTVAEGDEIKELDWLMDEDDYNTMFIYLKYDNLSES